jgi:signal transduction histidine kinase
LNTSTPVNPPGVSPAPAAAAMHWGGRVWGWGAGAGPPRGQMTQPERQLFAQTVADQRLLISKPLSPEFDADLRAPVQRVYSSPAGHAFESMENRIVDSIGSRKPIPVNPTAWQSASTVFLRQFGAATEQDRMLLNRSSAQVGDHVLLQLVLAGGLGLVAVVASVFLLARFGRRINRELTRLQEAARTMAQDQLPGLVRRLRSGEDVDVAAESPPLPGGRTTEIARVADAFSMVQLTAVEAAVGEANLRKGVSKVFLNLAWRSQALLHRQLTMLDAMERRSTEPEALDDLFRLDHLTTRMRRHAEGLTILSGSTSVRGWRYPVPMIDVLRGAIAEVEDYTRVKVTTQTKDTVVGAAVGDVIHLLAELIENATSCSPPNTPVTIAADWAANGFIVEVEDRGLGMSPADLQKWNRQLAVPPEFDVVGSDQLGLFVVSRLAARHQISITLRRSPYGGTTAIVLIPHAIVVPVGQADSAAGSGYPRRGVRPGSATPPVAGTMARQLTSAGPAVIDITPQDTTTGPVDLGPETAGEPAPRPAAPAPAARGDTYLDLPRRVRQASLAPQLRDTGCLSAEPAPEQAKPEARSPAESQSLLSSLQHGWQRGRAEAAEPRDLWTPEGGSGSAVDSAEPGGS